MKADDRISPLGMWRWGKDFIEAGLQIQQAPDNEIEELRQHVSVPAYYLITHGIELTLKAFLLISGVSPDDLKRKFGHNLEKILKAAIEQDLRDASKISGSDEKVVYLLNDNYKAKSLEYFLAGCRSLPRYSLVCGVALRLNEDVGKLIHSKIHQ